MLAVHDRQRHPPGQNASHINDLRGGRGAFIAVAAGQMTLLPERRADVVHSEPIDNETVERAIAARIRGILGGRDRGMVAETAYRLGVSEVALRMSIDELEPHPTIEVLIAIVREHGIDPCWLITGTYDAATHRAAVDEEAASSRRRVAEIVARQLTPVSSDGIPMDHPLRLER